MKIELSKQIKVKILEFVGEVNFFEESPYIKLLEWIPTKDELREELGKKGLTSSAIKNILNKLEDLGVLEYGDIVDVKKGFPEREYGKYILEMFENDTRLPFKFKNKEIKREKFVSRNRVDSIKKDKWLIETISEQSQNFSDNKKFQVIKLEGGNYLESNSRTIIRLHLNDNMWKYSIDKKIFDMKTIELNDIFEGNWDNNFNALKIKFSVIEKHENFILSFEVSYSNKVTLDEYGTLNGEFQNIPIIPKTKHDAKEWLLYLLKREIEKKERYISKDELHALWLNILDTKPQLDGFDLEFDFETILNQFGKESKYYWLLQAGIDLYPFNTGLTPKARVIIDNKVDIDLRREFVDKFNMNIPKELIIVDRWIVDVKQFRGLEKIIQAFGNPKVTIVTQEVKDKNANNRVEIQKIIARNNIKRITKQKNDIVHSRYWIFDNHKFYKTNNSLDVIKVEDENITIKEQTTFDLYEKDDLEQELMTVLGEINNG